MAEVQRIDLTLATGSVGGAGTDGDVYLGLGGREFSIDSPENDFERNTGLRYTFGESANVRFPEFNDPREPQLLSENIVRQPAYIRFVPSDREDNWNLLYAVVRLNRSLYPAWTTTTVNPDEGKGIWLGVHAGLTVYLTLQEAPIVQVQKIEESIAQFEHAF